MSKKKSPNKTARRGFSLSKEIRKVRGRIKKVAPEGSDLDIKINKDEREGFRSFIKVHIPPKKDIVAQKVDTSAPFSLEKSQNAVIKQIKKLKTKRSRARPV